MQCMTSVPQARLVVTLVTISILLTAVVLKAQDTLNNEAIVKMVKAGLSESTIIALIQQQPGSYSTKAADILALKEGGVPNAVIEAIVTKAAGKNTESSQSSQPQIASRPEGSPSEALSVKEVGVYHKKGTEWIELLPEVVNWRTGGVFKSIASMGVVSGDVNGVIQGPNSRNAVKTPVEFLIYTPEGVAISEYQLLRLRQKADRREFRTVTGGVLHASGGATRDLVPFEGKKIAPRTWAVVLPNIGPGEYGFLAPGAVGSQHAGAQLGKMYTFRLLE